MLKFGPEFLRLLVRALRKLWPPSLEQVVGVVCSIGEGGEDADLP